MNNPSTRREFIKKSATLAAVGLTAPLWQSCATSPAPAPEVFQPSWDSLAQNYHCPDWFRDAKFGIWAHWSAQCVPEMGDWYARQMYIQGHWQYNSHLKNYGHPTKFGFMEIDNLWKAEHWEPEKLMDLYVAAGAKYFVSLANHHDNFDNFNSKHHAWNSVKVGPRKDIIGTWAKIARARGLRFGVSNHSSHAWHWFQTAYGYDAEGPLAGARYDAYTLTAADGKGKWWEGLDPQELYGGRNLVMPDGITTVKEMNAWHEKNDRVWNENPPPMNPEFTRKWFLRCQDLLDSYRPDFLYFDSTGGLPLGQTGLDITAHFYNASLKWHHGKLEAVVTTKGIKPAYRGAVVEDYERGSSAAIQPAPWQTDTCIGDWHYNRSLFTQHRYKSVTTVVTMLVNVVSKNGNLLLNIPVRGDGSIDQDEKDFLKDLAVWMKINGHAIFASRPWKVFGEGPTTETGGMFHEKTVYGAHDIRFTTKDGALYAFALGWPAETLKIKSLGTTAGLLESPIAHIELLGSDERIIWSQEEDALIIEPPSNKPCDHAVAFKITSKV